MMSGLIDISGSPDALIQDYDTAKRIAETLHSHYPGHMWAVSCSAETGVANVYNLGLSGRWGFIIKLKDIIHDPSMKKVIMAGGEILERYRLARGRLDDAALEQLQSDSLGNLKVET